MTTIKEHFHVAVPTAFNTDETINTTITIEHIINLKNEGVNAIMLSGTTGEQHSLTVDDKISLLKAINSVNFNSDFEIIFGVSSIRQSDAIKLADKISEYSCINAILVGMPPYIMPTQEEAINYISAIIEHSHKPAILYNNPKRTGFDLSVDSIVALKNRYNIIGVKEAGDIQKIIELKKKLGKKDFLIYAGGEDNLEFKIKNGYNSLSSIWGNVYATDIKKYFYSLISNGKTIQLSNEILITMSGAKGKSFLPYLKESIAEKENIQIKKTRYPIGNNNFNI